MMKIFRPPAAVVSQLPPKKGETDIARLVQRDIELRAQMGEVKYGHRLQSSNGRDALIDLYQEILDAAMYLKQLLEESRRDKSPSP